MNGLYITDISFLHLISLYSRIIWVCIYVIHIVDFVESRLENIFSLSSVLILIIVIKVIVAMGGALCL